MGDIELNGIRYAAGFVVRKLKKKYQKLKRHGDYVDCLTRMITDESDITQDCDGSTTLQEYTKAWLKRTDRGGLSHISDIVFWLFCEIELLVYERIKKCYAGAKQPVAEIATWAVQDEDIQYIWSMIAVNISEEDMSERLLHTIAQEWAVLRGHVYRKKVLEDYKKSKDAANGKRSLRKELQRSHDQNTTHCQDTGKQDTLMEEEQVAEMEEEQVAEIEEEQATAIDDQVTSDWIRTEELITDEELIDWENWNSQSPIM